MVSESTSSSSHRYASPVPAAPILKLNRDLLWSIIELNTDIFSTNDALKSTQQYSQVCQPWRLFILEAPSLWGKLIDFNYLRHSTDLWRHEVLRRSGTSLLWMKGDLTGRPNDISPTQAFFFEILNNHWDRIQKIDIAINHNSKKWTCHNWRAIYQPAPHLQVFRVHPTVDLTDFHSSSCDELSSSPLPLFAHDAPSLRVIDAILTFPVHAPWLSALRDVCIGFPLFFPQILDALRAMPLLTSLKIRDFDFPEPGIPTNTVQSPIHLPSLSELSIHANLSKSLRTFACFQLAPCCSVAIHPSLHNLGDNNLNNDESAPNLLALSKFTQKYFQYHRPKAIYVQSSFAGFLFTDSLTRPRPRIMPTPFFSLIVACSPLTRETSHLLFGAFSLPALVLQSVTQLHLKVHPSSLPDAFMAFASSLNSVNTITATENTLISLLNAQGRALVILFPLLRVLRLEEPIIESNWQPKGIHLLSFLDSRKGAGFPVEVLDLTELNGSDRLSPAKEHLEGMAGLTVIWPLEAHREPA